MSYLLDTNILSEMRKGARTNPGVASWMANTAHEKYYVSAIVIGEIRKGIELKRLRDPRSAEALDRWLRGLIRHYDSHVLSVDREVAEVWGRLNVPDPRSLCDSLIAATAEVHNLTVVTRNIKDFRLMGVPCLNPFT